MGRLPRHRIGVMALVVTCALATTVATTVVSTLPVHADAIGDKQAEAAALSDKLHDQAQKIVALDVQLRRAQDRVDDAQAGVEAAEQELEAATKRQDGIKRQLVVQAQDAYVVGGSVSVLRYLVRTDSHDEVARRAYLRIVTGQDRELIGQLRATKEDLADRRARLEAARKRAHDEADSLAGDRSDLDRAIRSQRANLQQVNGELASLVAAEQARRDAEAAQEAAARKAAADAARQSPQPASAPDRSGRITLLAPVEESFACIRQLESGNNYASPGGGAYQFTDATWQGLGYSGTASDAPPAVQDEAAHKLQAQRGWQPWTVAPLCGLL